MAKDFLLQINPKEEYRLYDALRSIPPGSREIVLNDGRRSHPRLSQGRRVYLWEAGGRDLIGRGTVLEERAPRAMPRWQQEFLRVPHDPVQPRAVIRVDALVEPPLSRVRLQMDPVVSNAPFFRNDKNTTGTVFYVETPTADALDRLIGFAPEVAGQFFHELTGAEEDGAFNPDADENNRRRELRAIAVRQGQPAFRRALLEAYDRRCAVTDADIIDCLEAAHILPYINEDRNHVSNGILLRADVHTLFDLGLLTVARDHQILIAPSLRDTEYGRYIAGRKLRLPKNAGARPSEEALERHRRQCRAWVST